MKRCWKFFLYNILLFALITASIVPVASECASEDGNETGAEESFLTSEADSSPGGGVISEAFSYLTSMLGLLDVTLRLTNSTLEAHLSEYPFLAGTLEGTDRGVEAVDSMLFIMDPDQQVVNRTSL